MPIATAPGIADANDFGVCGGIPILHTEIVAARDDAASAVGEY